MADMYTQIVEARKRTAKATAAKHPDCQTCQTIAAEGGYGPSHDASERCESGKREHCTCDTCF